MTTQLIIPTAKGEYTALPNHGKIDLKSPTGQVVTIEQDEFKKFIVANVPNIKGEPRKDSYISSASKSSPSMKGSTKRKKSAKIGTGLASFFAPGLGQLCKGEVKKGALFFFGNIALYLPLLVSCATNKMRKTAIAFTLLTLPLAIWSTVDAYRDK